MQNLQPPAGNPQRRTVRSFVRRQGRITSAQRRALDTLWAHYGVEAQAAAVLDLDRVFGRRAPRVLEIGFGNGDALLTLAARNPGTDYLGIEVHRPGIGHLFLGLQAAGLDNVRVLCADARQVLEHHLADDALDQVCLFFPDPWVKKRHHKRRLVQEDFVELVRRRLKPGGRLDMATDWGDYAGHMMEVLSAAPGFRNLAGPGIYAPRPDFRPPTRFEQRGQRLGHRVWDLAFQREEPPATGIDAEG